MLFSLCVCMFSSTIVASNSIKFTQLEPEFSLSYSLVVVVNLGNLNMLYLQIDELI